jgi:hypothetical protein
MSVLQESVFVAPLDVRISQTDKVLPQNQCPLAYLFANQIIKSRKYVR